MKMTFPYYIVASSLLLASFYFFYSYFREKHFSTKIWNFYLIGASIFSIILPIFMVSIIEGTIIPSFITSFLKSTYNLNSILWVEMRAGSPNFSISNGDILTAIYLFGAFLLSC